LLAATLLAGAMIGAVVYAAVGAAIAQPAAVSVPHTSTVVHDQQFHAVRGLLIRDAPGDSGASTTSTTGLPKARDGFGIGVQDDGATDSVSAASGPFTYVPGKRPLP
jgi:hypothetical protein